MCCSATQVQATVRRSTEAQNLLSPHGEQQPVKPILRRGSHRSLPAAQCLQIAPAAAAAAAPAAPAAPADQIASADSSTYMYGREWLQPIAQQFQRARGQGGGAGQIGQGGWVPNAPFERAAGSGRGNHPLDSQTDGAGEHRGHLPAPSGANKKPSPRGAPMQHLAPRRNPEWSKGHLTALD